MAANRETDYFWGPLMGLHLLLRLGEIVTLKLDDIGRDKPTGIWYLDVAAENAKNRNSIRRLPITQPLIDLGFIEYVEHARRIGARYLWPHRDLTTTTARKLPSKNQSAQFGRYLDEIGIVDRLLVFHSFRHTGVTALLDGGTPVHVSMQIAGHEAQDQAIRPGLITADADRSVHLTTYTHADLQRAGVQYPLEQMKNALEKCIHPPLDYSRLQIASQIVLEHTRKVGTTFKTGWPPQRTNYTEVQLERLNRALK